MRHACLFVFVILASVQCQAASLRPDGQLRGPVVRVADLFDDAGAGAARVLGPAPAPGGRITVGAEQLAGIAHEFGVEWSPGSSGDQITLDRPGQMVPAALVLAALRPALVADGLGSDFDIALAAYDPPVVDLGAPRLSVITFDFEAGSGRFDALLSASVDNTTPVQWRVSGSAQPALELPVPTHRLMAGEVVTADDIAMMRIRANTISTDVARLPVQVIGMQLRSMHSPGQPLPMADLRNAILVNKGDRVMMGLAIPGLTLGGVGLAMEQGGLGDRIAVRNPGSGATVTAEITGAGAVNVDPNAPAVLAHDSFAALAAR